MEQYCLDAVAQSSRDTGGDIDSTEKSVVAEDSQRDSSMTMPDAKEPVLTGRDKKESMEHPAVANKSLAPPKEEHTPYRAAACDCGEVLLTGRGAIFCANSACRRGAFHMSCVGLASRDASWTCADCMRKLS